MDKINKLEKQIIWREKQINKLNGWISWACNEGIEFKERKAECSRHLHKLDELKEKLHLLKQI